MSVIPAGTQMCSDILKALWRSWTLKCYVHTLVYTGSLYMIKVPAHRSDNCHCVQIRYENGIVQIALVIGGWTDRRGFIQNEVFLSEYFLVTLWVNGHGGGNVGRDRHVSLRLHDATVTSWNLVAISSNDIPRNQIICYHRVFPDLNSQIVIDTMVTHW